MAVFNTGAYWEHLVDTGEYDKASDLVPDSSSDGTGDREPSIEERAAKKIASIHPAGTPAGNEFRRDNGHLL